MDKELKDAALTIFCAQANRLMIDNEANARYNKGLAESSISYARIFLQACKEYNDESSISSSTDMPVK